MKSDSDNGAPNNSLENEPVDWAGDCPNPRHWTRKRENPHTGDTTEEKVLLSCRRKGCPACGPRLYDDHVDHYVEKLAPHVDQLRFLTLTFDKKVDPGASQEKQEAILTEVWKKYRKRINDRSGRREGEFLYVYGIEYGENGIPHLHVVMLAPLGTETLKNLWFDCGGGLVCDVKEIENLQHLSNAVAYSLQDAFYGEENSWTGYRRAVGASQGIGYYSEDDEEESPGEPGDDNTVSSWQEYVRWHREALQPGETGEVELPGGRAAGLLEVSRGFARVVRENGKVELWDALDVVPAGSDPPLIESWECEATGGMRHSIAAKIDVSDLDLENRSTRFRYVDEEGREVEVRYNPDTGKRTREFPALARACK